MHNFLEFTDIKIVLILFFSVTLLIFPLFLSVNALFLSDLKKAYAGIYLFGFIKIIGGYAEKIEEGVALHVSDKKAFIIPFASLSGAREKIKPFMDYHFISVTTVTELGSNDNLITPLSAAFIASFVESIIAWYFSLKKPYLKLDNRFNVYAGKKTFNLYFKALFVFNAITVISSIIKILTEKTFYAIKQRKSKN